VQIDFGGGDDVAFLRQGFAGIIRLARPAVLNSLNLQMTDAIARAFAAWAGDENVALVLIEGEGRAFCAGGDVVAVWKAQAAGEDIRPFFAAEYRLNRFIGHFPKPCISFLDGFVMGGGAGLAMHGSHRIATEKTLFAMPEAAIGFFPDVGMGTLLARMEGHFGLYLGLSAARILNGDCFHFGLATHMIPTPAWPHARQQLIDKADLSVLATASQAVTFDTSAADRALIAHCFAAETVGEIMERLEDKAQTGNDFAAHTLGLMQAHSPISLHVIHKYLVLARHLTLDACLQLDYRLACHLLEEGDFHEGVRARLIDKDNKPHWRFAHIGDVPASLTDACFMPLSKELDFDE